MRPSAAGTAFSNRQPAYLCGLTPPQSALSFRSLPIWDPPIFNRIHPVRASQSRPGPRTSQSHARPLLAPTCRYNTRCQVPAVLATSPEPPDPRNLDRVRGDQVARNPRTVGHQRGRCYRRSGSVVEVSSIVWVGLVLPTLVSVERGLSVDVGCVIVVPMLPGIRVLPLIDGLGLFAPVYVASNFVGRIGSET